jgi:hypothetical protein
VDYPENDDTFVGDAEDGAVVAVQQAPAGCAEDGVFAD